jgi:hypothetical protein
MAGWLEQLPTEAPRPGWDFSPQGKGFLYKSNILAKSFSKRKTFLDHFANFQTF